jgi:hypothetical protein
MRLLHRNLLVLLGCIALEAGVAHPALAQSDADRATARSLGQDGEKALDAKDYKTAEDRFRRADSLVHAPTLMLGLARALAGEGKFVEAGETYNRILRDGVAPGAPPVFRRAVEDAKKEVQDVGPRIGGVTITVKTAAGADVPNPTVTLDDTPVNAASLGVRRLIDPGDHVVHVTADGYKPTDLRLTVAPGGSANAPIVLEKADVAAPLPATPVPGPVTPAPEPASSGGGGSALPWVAFGVGGVGVGVGAVAGILALGKHSDLSKACQGGTCGADQKSALDSYHSLGLISTIGFVVGAVGAAAGVTLLVVGSHHAEPAASTPAASLYLGPGSIGAVGRF